MYTINNFQFDIKDIISFKNQNTDLDNEDTIFLTPKYKLVVGAVPYALNPLNGVTWGIYSQTNNNIAFFKSNRDKPCSLLRILSMLLKSTQDAVKLLVEIDNNSISQEELAKFLYYKTNIAFINRKNLSPSKIKTFLLNVTDMLIIGTNAPYKQFAKAVLSLNSSIKVSITIHTSSRNYYDFRYFPTWYQFIDSHLVPFSSFPLTPISKF